jgi:HD-GYP domain-containing protein (c-di-GMP phosphodiesterase class II)
MKYPLTPDVNSQTVSIKQLSGLIRVINTISQQTQPEIFTHVQPHAHATAKLARQFAAAVECSGGSSCPTLEEIEFGAHLHDVGKYFIAASVLLKPGALDEEERAAVCLHSVIGATVISKLPEATEAIRHVVLYHHEHWDGSGYPEGLCGSAIPLVARIISIVDVYTSLRSRRSYKPMLTKQEAIAILIGMAGRELDPCIVEDFLILIENRQPMAKRIRIFI